MHITFDLETLGVSSQAPIIQIGAVKFHEHGEIIDTFLRNIDLKSLERYDFKIEPDTLKWWFSQDDKAIKSVFCQEDAVNIRLALIEYIDWIGELSKYYYWSHATFDPPILNNTFIKIGLKNPIPFRLYRDIRTLNHFAGRIEVERKGIHHNALDDCLYQAEYISKGLMKLRNQK